MPTLYISGLCLELDAEDGCGERINILKNVQGYIKQVGKQCRRKEENVTRDLYAILKYFRVH